MAGILTEIISLLTGGITGVASGIGQGLSTLASAVFLDTTGTNPITLIIYFFDQVK